LNEAAIRGIALGPGAAELIMAPPEISNGHFAASCHHCSAQSVAQCTDPIRIRPADAAATGLFWLSEQIVVY